MRVHNRADQRRRELTPGEKPASRRRRSPVAAAFARAAVIAASTLLLLPACSQTDDAGAADSNSVPAPAEPVEQSLDPEFSLTRVQLEDLTADLPSDISASILERPAEFLHMVRAVSAQPQELLWQVDRQNPLPEDYEPEDIVQLDEYSDRLDLSREGHRLRAVALPDLLLMVDAAKQEGVTLLISSVYRSYEYQAGVYDYWVETLGQDEADRVSAAPGTSQHQLGTTIDFGCICDEFADTAAGQWLAAHAWEYGFSLSYPAGYEDLTGYSWESWHYRYIGREASRMVRDFFAGIQYYFLDFAATSIPLINATAD